MQRPLLIVAMATLLPLSAYAHPMMPIGGCMRENATININFNIKTQSFSEAKQKFDDELKQLNSFAKQQHIEKLTLQSMNYNVNSGPAFNGGMTSDANYQLNGNASYHMESADDAFKLGDFLTKQHFTVNVNVSRYGSGTPCSADNNPPSPMPLPVGATASPPPPPPAETDR